MSSFFSWEDLVTRKYLTKNPLKINKYFLVPPFNQTKNADDNHYILSLEIPDFWDSNLIFDFWICIISNKNNLNAKFYTQSSYP